MKNEKNLEKELREVIDTLDKRLYWTYCSAMTLLGSKVISYDEYCQNIDKAIRKTRN